MAGGGVAVGSSGGVGVLATAAGVGRFGDGDRAGEGVGGGVAVAAGGKGAGRKVGGGRIVGGGNKPAGAAVGGGRRVGAHAGSAQAIPAAKVSKPIMESAINCRIGQL